MGVFDDIDQEHAQELIDTERPYRQVTATKGRPESLSDWISAGFYWSKYHSPRAAYEFFEYPRKYPHKLKEGA